MTTARELTLPPMDRTVRLAQVRAAMVDLGCEALLITKPENIRWLSGFTGSNGTAVVTADDVMLITDGRYETQVAQQLDAAQVVADVRITRENVGPLTEAVAGAARIGLESEAVTWAEQLQFVDWFSGQELVPTTDVIEALRRVKDDGELARLRRAAAIADAALDAVRLELANGRSERWIARALDGAMLDQGADDLSFDTIVAAGPNSAKPHAVPSDRVIESGDMVVMDFGAAVDGYGSDMTRSFLIGAPTAKQQSIYDAVQRAQAAGVAAVRDGVAELEVDRVCRDSLAEDGLGDAFVHGTGHGIGLEIHENPILSTRASGILRSGYVVTVEPGAYLPELGGVRIEDSVVVTASGSETITLSPKDPTIELK